MSESRRSDCEADDGHERSIPPDSERHWHRAFKRGRRTPRPTPGGARRCTSATAATPDAPPSRTTRTCAAHMPRAAGALPRGALLPLPPAQHVLVLLLLQLRHVPRHRLIPPPRPKQVRLALKRLRLRLQPAGRGQGSGFACGERTAAVGNVAATRPRSSYDVCRAEHPQALVRRRTDLTCTVHSELELNGD